MTRRDDLFSVGVVGAGRWANVHLTALRQIENVQCIGVVGRSKERVEHLARRHNVPVIRSIDALTDLEPSLVTVATGDDEHYGPCRELLTSGIATLVEKPLVMKLTEAISLLDVARANGTRFGVGFSMRYLHAMQLAASSIRRGELGELEYAYWRFGHHVNATSRRKELSMLIYMQGHGFNLLRALVGPIHSVVAQAPRDEDGSETAAVLIDFKDGGVGALVGSTRSINAAEFLRLELLGESGRILVDDAVSSFEYTPKDGGFVRKWRPFPFDVAELNYQASVRWMLEDAIAAQRADLPEPIPAEEGYDALRAGLACALSIREGRSVLLSEIGPDRPAPGAYQAPIKPRSAASATDPMYQP